MSGSRCLLTAALAVMLCAGGPAVAREAEVPRSPYPQMAEPGPTAPADYVADADISEAIEQAYREDARVDADAIEVDTLDGIVTLRGRVADELAVNRAVELALETEGVRSVRLELDH